METTFKSLLAAAKENLEKYKRLGDEDAIRAGEGMVKDFEWLVEEEEKLGL